VSVGMPSDTAYAPFDQTVVDAPPAIELAQGATMEEMIAALWRLPRDIVSDGYDAALYALATQVPMQIHEYASGTECWTWIVPEKWTCNEAWLETADGNRLFSYADHPLHVVSYSLPFEGLVTRDQLFKHLHVHPTLPEAVPFVFKYYERDWGLCCTQRLKDSLTDEQYRVVIRTSFSPGTLKVGEVVVPGRSADSIVLCAHLCHPRQVNDDLTGVVVGIDVMRHLMQCADLHYTYRLLIVPETIGSIAWLSHHERLIPSMRGGLFLEMLGRDYPHALQLSYAGDAEVDMCFSLALRASDVSAWTGKFRSVVGNDERQFNAPGVRVPMLSLSRVLPASSGIQFCPEYHSSDDTPAAVPSGALARSRELVLQMLDTIDRNSTPRNRFKGEVFLSRFGLHVDERTDPERRRALFAVLDFVDGTMSLAEIAMRSGISFQTVREVVEQLAAVGLVDWPRERARRGASPVSNPQDILAASSQT